MKDYYIVYAKDGCSYCDKAIGTLREQKQPFMIGDLTHNLELLEAIKEQNRMTTVPIVQYVVHRTIPGHDQPMPHPMLVGGSDDLIKHFEEPEEEQSGQG